MTQTTEYVHFFVCKRDPGSLNTERMKLDAEMYVDFGMICYDLI